MSRRLRDVEGAARTSRVAHTFRKACTIPVYACADVPDDATPCITTVSESSKSWFEQGSRFVPALGTGVSFGQEVQSPCAR